MNLTILIDLTIEMLHTKLKMATIFIWHRDVNDIQLFINIGLTIYLIFFLVLQTLFKMPARTKTSLQLMQLPQICLQQHSHLISEIYVAFSIHTSKMDQSERNIQICFVKLIIC